VTVKTNHDYTVTCTDGRGVSVSFRDMTGNDIEFLEDMVSEDGKSVNPESVIKILDRLKISPVPASVMKLTPRAIQSLYEALSEHVLCNYVNKETWLKQCYSIQNGSFQNVSEMEKVPMSKFAAMCLIHKEAIDQMNNTNPDVYEPPDTEV
jgi:hypothetical protein